MSPPLRGQYASPLHPPSYCPLSFRCRRARRYGAAHLFALSSAAQPQWCAPAAKSGASTQGLRALWLSLVATPAVRRAFYHAFRVVARARVGVARRSLHAPMLPLGRLFRGVARLPSVACAFASPTLSGGRHSLHCVRRAGALSYGPPCGGATGVRLCQAFRLPLRSRPVAPIVQSSGGHRTPPAPQSLGGVATPFRRRALCLARLGARAGTPSGRPLDPYGSRVQIFGYCCKFYKRKK